jgi:hypothetical protein
MWIPAAAIFPAFLVFIVLFFEVELTGYLFFKLNFRVVPHRIQLLSTLKSNVECSASKAQKGKRIQFGSFTLRHSHVCKQPLRIALVIQTLVNFNNVIKIKAIIIEKKFI